MTNKIGFIYSIFSYLVGFSAILLWIVFTGNLFPQFTIDGPTTMDTLPAILKNLGLIVLFGIQHSVMARQSFKKWLTRYIPEHLERSTYVLASGLLLGLLTWQWEPLGGVIWAVPAGTAGYYVLYSLFFLGWGILFLSSFLINHFDLFGLRQAYLKMVGQPYTELRFKIFSLYKFVRHPLYFGMVLGVWSTPLMTVTHLVYAILITSYVLVGIYYEEKDLVRAFGQDYTNYQESVPKLIPLTKIKKQAPPTKVEPVA